MIFGIGTDAADIERTGRLSQHAIEKIFHPTEIAEYEALSSAAPEVRNQFLASRFAVKEAYAKARGLGFCSIINPNEICTVKNEKGKPSIALSGETALHAPDLISHVSITHQAPLAIAFVVLEEKN